MLSHVLRTLFRHWGIVLIMAVSGVLLFTNLGAGYLWADEGDTAVLARNITQFGIPRAWDGITFMDSDYGARVNDHLVMVSSPWLQYYVTAASFFLFGENTFAARVAFALVGLATVWVAYYVAANAAADFRAGI